MGYTRVSAFLSVANDADHDLSSNSVEVKDISLTDYIQVRHAVYLPHTAGRYAKKQFKKAQMPIVERLVDRYITTRNLFATKLLTRSLQV
jgi:small subunit ribosomal protein S5e